MNEWATDKIISWLSVDKNSITGMKIGFYIETVLSEIEKMLIILLVFSVLGYFKNVAIVLLIIMVIRPYIGGTHEDTFTGCLAKTAFICTIPICLEGLLLDGYKIHIVVTLMLLCIIWTIGPVTSKHRPKYEGEALRRIRIKATTMVFIISICYIKLDVVYRNEMTVLLLLLEFDVILARLYQVIEKKKGGKSENEG